MAIFDIAKALGDETKLEIVRFLRGGKKNATQIVLHVKKSQPNTSLALKNLYLVGIVEQEKIGRQVYYKLRKQRQVEQILDALEEIAK